MTTFRNLKNSGSAGYAFMYMGIPKAVLTDNMKSVVIRRDSNGYPVWKASVQGVNNKAFVCRGHFERSYGD